MGTGKRNVTTAVWPLYTIILVSVQVQFSISVYCLAS